MIQQLLRVVVSVLLISPSSSWTSFSTHNNRFCVSSQKRNNKFDQNGKIVWTKTRARNPDGDDEIPNMDWLTNTLAKPSADDDGTESRNIYDDEKLADLNTSPYMEEHDIDGDLGDVPIPTTGVSVSDEMTEAQKTRFFTEIVPITGLGKGVKAVRILSSTTDEGSYEAVRYLVRLSRNYDEDDNDNEDNKNRKEETTKAASTPDTSSAEHSDEEFVMIDVPPFSEKLVKEMKSLMGPNGRLSTILVTSRDCIHFEDAPGTFTITKHDLTKWKKAFPDTATVAYRMDIPRNCREAVTQRLDGYGPWAAMEKNIASNPDDNSCFFMETGLPFTVNEWEPELAQEILTGKRKPPGEENDEKEDDDTVIELDENGKYPLEEIRAKEEGKRILAVYTPGRSYGSMTYVFPELDLCLSGFSLPIEDSRGDENHGMDSAGPALDHRGYITTSKAGMTRQIESARKLVNTYVDRFDILLTARGDPFYLDGNTEDRRQTLLGIMDQYEKLGSIYEQLGISGPNENRV